MASGGRGAADLAGRTAVDRAVAAVPRTRRLMAAALLMGGAAVLVRSARARRAAWLLVRTAARLAPVVVANELQRAWRAAAPPGGHAR